MRTVWWALLGLAVAIVVFGVAYVIWRRARRVMVDGLTDGSLLCQWAKADALVDTGIDTALGDRLRNDLEVKHGLDYPIAIRSSHHFSSAEHRLLQDALPQARGRYVRSDPSALTDTFLRLQKKARSLWTGKDATCVSAWEGETCNESRLYALDHGVNYTQAMQALKNDAIEALDVSELDAAATTLRRGLNAVDKIQTRLDEYVDAVERDAESKRPPPVSEHRYREDKKIARLAKHFGRPPARRKRKSVQAAPHVTADVVHPALFARDVRQLIQHARTLRTKLSAQPQHARTLRTKLSAQPQHVRARMESELAAVEGLIAAKQCKSMICPFCGKRPRRSVGVSFMPACAGVLFSKL